MYTFDSQLLPLGKPPGKQIEHHPVRLEAEFVVLGNTRLHVVRKEVRRWEGGGRTIYYVEER